MRGLLVLLALVITVPTFGQPLLTEDECKEVEGYWKETPGACFLRSDMDSDQVFLLDYIRTQEAVKAQFQHERQEFNASGKTTRRNNFDARIASLTVRKNATSEQSVKDTYQTEIDRTIVTRDRMDDFDVSAHGTIISALSSDIGKHKEELDGLLP